MTTIATPATTRTHSGRWLRSAAAVFLGFISVAVLSLAACFTASGTANDNDKRRGAS